MQEMSTHGFFLLSSPCDLFIYANPELVLVTVGRLVVGVGKEGGVEIRSLALKARGTSPFSLLNSS